MVWSRLGSEGGGVVVRSRRRSRLRSLSLKRSAKVTLLEGPAVGFEKNDEMLAWPFPACLRFFPEGAGAVGSVGFRFVLEDNLGFVEREA